MNIESILKQIQEAEAQIRRLKTLILADDSDILSSEENLSMVMECCKKARFPLGNIEHGLQLYIWDKERERRMEILIELTKESQEMGLYDDTRNPMIKEPE